MNPTLEKMLWLIMAVGMYALSVWPPMAGIRDVLVALAGAGPAAAFLRSVDDRRAAKEERRRSSLPPPDPINVPVEDATEPPTIPDRPAVKPRVPR